MKKIILATMLAMSVAACSSTPDPEKVCTTNWVEKRSKKAVGAIYKDTNSAVNSLRKVGTAYMEGKTPNMFKLFSLARNVSALDKELRRGSGIRDLKTLARTCGDTKILTDGFNAYMNGLELPKPMQSFIEGLPQFKDMIAGHIRDLQDKVPSN